jgi:hypothetical protein
MGLGIRRGTSDSSAAWSGVCRGFTEPQRSLLSSIGPLGRSPQPLALSNGSEVPRRRGEPLFRT